MGADKGNLRTGGFFQLFDWNRKSRKKLFTSGISPEGTKQIKKFDNTLPAIQLHLIDDDEYIGVPSIKGSSDHSYASSVTDEDGSGTRAPGVVARLMGLDSMPSSSFPEPFSTPFNDSRSRRDNHSQSRSPEFYVNDKLNYLPGRAGSYLRKPMEPRSLKMPSSPVERFQTEILPPRTAKSLPISHHKLLSPIKNPGFTSTKNAAQIMEAAAKILDPGFNNQPNMKVKVPSLGSSSVPLKVHDPSESMMTLRRTSHLLQLSKITTVEFVRKQSLNRDWNATEDIVIFRSSPDPYEINAAAVGGNGKSISLAVQAKVNVQRRESLGMPNGNTQMRKESEECKINQSFRSHQNNQSTKQQRKSSTYSAPVLRQNNQKQNCPLSKVKSASKQLTANQPRRKVLSGDASCTKHKTANKISGNSRVGSRKQGLDSIDLTREGGTSSNNKDFPQKKRLTEGNFNSKKSLLADRIVVDRHEIPGQPSVAIDEHTRWNEDRKNSTNVVSFTFTSPLVKSSGNSESSTEVVEKGDKQNDYRFDAFSGKKDSDSKAISTLGLNVLSGDALSRLLEQKLKELTSEIDPSGSFIKAANLMHTVPDHSEPGSASDTFDTIPAAQQAVPKKSHPNAVFLDSNSTSTHRQVLGMSQRKQVVEEDVFNSNSDALKKLENQHTSPLSVLEASSFNDSWQSYESSGSTDGSICQSSVLALNILNSAFSRKSASQVTDFELSDSASSAFIESASGFDVRERRDTKEKDSDMDFVREILNKTGLNSKNLSSYSCARESFNPLFEKCESITIKKEEKCSRTSRKLLFDCLQECLDLQCGQYFQAGYQAWSKGVLFKRKDLAETVNVEISGWKRMGEWAIDELVDNDMSTHFGKWVDFEIESFETGREIAAEIFTSLIDEILADLCLTR